MVGSGVDIAAIKPALESATSLNVSVPEEPETALARGAALASANAPLFASSTAALAYAQDPGPVPSTRRSMPEYFGVSTCPTAPGSATTTSPTAWCPTRTPTRQPSSSTRSDLVDPGEAQPRRRPVLLLGSGMAVVAISAVVALEIALAIGIRNDGQ